jgi:hypothetical protein
MKAGRFSTASVLTVMIIGFCILASVVGLLGGVYRDETPIENAWYGTDIVTLCMVVPLLVWALIQKRKNAERALLVWAGGLGYTAYNYAFYLFGAQFNALFLVYVALFSLSIYALVLLLSAMDLQKLAAHFRAKVPVKAIAVFLLLVALPLAAFEVAQCLRYLFTGRLPDAPSLIFALDLSVVVPTSIVAAALLWQRRPWGYVLGAIMLVKAATYGLALCLSTAFVAGFRASGHWDPLLPFYGFIALGGLAGSYALLRHLTPQPS